MSPAAEEARSRRPAPARKGGAAGGRLAPPSSRLAAFAIVLLALALHARDLTIGFPERDLTGLDAVLRTSLAGLLRGGALPEGFTPLSRELWLWWWGKTLGLQSLGFHLLGAAVAALAGWLIFRLGRRLGGVRVGWIALALAVTFPPLGAMLSSAMAARDLLAVAACAAALRAYARGDTIPAALLAGAATASRETAALLPLVLLVLDLRLMPGDSRARRAARLAPAVIAVGAILLWTGSVAPWRLDPRPWTVPLELAAAWLPPGVRAGLAATWRAAPWLPFLILALASFTVPGRWDSPRPRAAADVVAPGLALAVCGLLPLAFAAPPRHAEGLAVAALGVALAAAGALARLPG